MPAASHQLQHAAFIVSTDPGLRGDDDEEDHSLVYAYPSEGPPSGSAATHVNSFKSLSLAIRGVLDSICGEKTKVVQLEDKAGSGQLMLASAHLQSCMLLVALRGGCVAPLAAHQLVVQLAETLVLLIGPFAHWGADTRTAGFALHPETQAILDRVFQGVLSQIDSPAWTARMAPWHCFQSSCLHLALPPKLQQRLAALAADHAAQHSRAPFAFFRKHSCLMFRGLQLSSDLHPLHAKQLWQLLWTLGVFQHSGGLPCQLLTRIIHLPQPIMAGGGAAATAAAAAAAAAGRAATGGPAVAAAAAVAMQADAAVTVSEEPMGRSLLVVAAAVNLVLAVVLTAYDEEIEEELAGRLEGLSAAELLHKIHGGMGAELERLVEASAAYSSTARSLEVPAQLHDAGASTRPPAAATSAKPPGSSLFQRLMTRNRSSARRRGGAAGPGPGPAAAAAPSMTGAGLASMSIGAGSISYRSTPPSPGLMPPGGAVHHAPPGLPAPSPSSSVPHPASPPSNLPTPFGAAPPLACLGPTSLAPTPSTAYDTLPAYLSHPHDRSARGGAASALMSYHRTATGGLVGSLSYSLAPAPQPVAAPEGALFVVAHDAPGGCVRFLGDLPDAGALAAVWTAVAACRQRFGVHTVAVAAPPKHARLTMTLDQIEQLSAARSQREGGQRLGTADSSPWQYHPEMASTAAVHTITVRLPLPPSSAAALAAALAPTQQQQPAQGVSPAGEGQAGPKGGGGDGSAMAQQQAKSWLTRPPSGRASSRTGTAGGASHSDAASNAAGPGAAAGGAGFATGVGTGSAAAAAPALYLTACLLPDMRELYVCHGAAVDEARLVEGLWDGLAAQVAWRREGSTQAA